MLDHLQGDTHQQFLSSLRGRKGAADSAVALAEPYVSQAIACVGGTCQASAPAALKAAEQLPTYFGNGFTLETKETSSGAFKLLLPEGIEPPKHTLMVLRHVVTTPREDRDKDVLVTAGASVDPAMPLLWQHMIGLPIGKLITTIDKTPDVLRVATALLDLNELTADAAKLIEANALRFSHGFRVLEYRERKAENGREIAGFEVTQFEILEVSLVSVPSNVDAVIEMYAKGGLNSEPFKRFAKGLDDARVKVVAVGATLPARKEIDDADAIPVDGPADDPTPLESEKEPEGEQTAEKQCTCGAAKKESIPFARDNAPAANPSQEKNPSPASEPAAGKAGRVLSKRNLERLNDIRADLQEMHDYDGMPRPCKAMCKTAMKTLDEVVEEASGSDGEPEEEKGAGSFSRGTMPAQPAAAEQFSAAVFAADAATLKRYRRAIDAALEAEELNHLSDELAELFGV